MKWWKREKERKCCKFILARFRNWHNARSWWDEGTESKSTVQICGSKTITQIRFDWMHGTWKCAVCRKWHYQVYAESEKMFGLEAKTKVLPHTQLERIRLDGWIRCALLCQQATASNRAIEQSSNRAAESRNSMERVSSRSHQEPARAGLTDSTCLSLDASTVQVAR